MSEERVPVRVERNVLIPLSGGVRLAADLFLPPAEGRFPVVICYEPYHKDDLLGALFDRPNRYFAARGYAALQVDFRGLGGSEGVAWDMGDPGEDADGAEIVEWAAAQDWCDGNVGMWGHSYGGLTAFKTAALHPPHLRAIAPLFGFLDFYEDFLYPGGCLNGLGAIGGWGTFMVAMNLLPPMHHDPEGRWYRIWRERLEQARTPWIMPPLEHPLYDEYWQPKKTAADRVEVPSFVMGGWRDTFPDVVVRAYEHINAPKRLIMGPWMHEMPDLVVSSPVDYVAEMELWWDRWLKGLPNGVESKPPVTIYVQGAGWRHEHAWPIARTNVTTAFLGTPSGARGALVSACPPATGEVTYRADPTVGVTAGLWDPTGPGLGAPLDQGPDDLRSITFTGDPLPDDLEITGFPEATLYVALDEGDDANLVVKLCDVAADGHSALITTGWLRASHRLTHEKRETIPLGQVLEFRVPLWVTSYRVPAGHRLRLSISCADFPRIWPTQTNPMIRLSCGGSMPSRVLVPFVPALDVPGQALAVPDPDVNRTPYAIEAQPAWNVSYDFVRDAVIVSAGMRMALTTPARDGRFEIVRKGQASVPRRRPDGATYQGDATITVRTPSGSTVVVEGRVLQSFSGNHISGHVTVDGETIFARSWEC